MSISASQIVQVNPRIIAAGANNLEFNGLLLSKNNAIPTGQVLQFADPDGVSEYFGSASTEAKLSRNYFLGYDNSFIKPKKLFFAKYEDNALAGYIRGAKLSTSIENIKKDTDGTLTLLLGQEITLENLDFSSVETFSDAAVILQEKIRAAGESESLTAATVEYSSLHSGFIITSGTAGSKSIVGYATGNMAGELGLSEAAGAVLSQGTDAVNYNDCMENILAVTQNWVNFTTCFIPAEADVLGFAEWANSKGVDFLFLYVDSDPKLLQSNSTTTIAAKIKEKQLSAVAGVYGDLEYAVFLMAIGASIDWNRLDAIVTAAFKAQQGLPANVTNSADATNLLSQGMNFLGDYATRNDQFVFTYAGAMFGKYAWIDAYWGAVWMKNQIQASCMLGFQNSGRTPYNERGYTKVRAWIQDPINRALNNGVIDSGVVLSESQKVQVNQEAGKDVASDIEYTGYYLEVKDPGASARVSRESPQINFYYTYGGSINKLDIPATMLN